MTNYQTLLRTTLLLSLLFISSCNANLPKIQLPNGKKVTIKLAIKEKDLTKGLSGTKNNEFSKSDGMLFLYNSNEPRQFWMPNTYFDLYIIFLNKDLKILHIDTNAKAHPGMIEPPNIYRTALIVSRYILEMRADSELAQSLKVGDILKWDYKKDISNLSKEEPSPK